MSDDQINSDYQKKKAFFDSLLTIYGRKPVLEALQQLGLEVYKVHLADSNKPGGIVDDILRIAESRAVPVAYHDKQALSRISRNGKQDQGVAADVRLKAMTDLEGFLHRQNNKPFSVIALDRITNPQNLGMIIRSIAASGVDGLLLPAKGCAPLSPLVIKASAGAIFKAPIIRCESLANALPVLRDHGSNIVALSSYAQQSLFDYNADSSTVFVLGNETDGVSKEIQALATTALKIPMHNGVESLNVAITAALIAFNGC